MDTPRITRVLVTVVASVMVLSALAVLFDAPDNHAVATGNQTMSTINGGENPQVLSAVSAAQTYTVTFQNIGLPYGTSWSVTIDGNNTVSSIGTSLLFMLPNGTHTFEVSKPTNYLADPSDGVIFVYGSTVVQYITFSLIEYSVNFVQTGLPAGSSWSVNLSGDVKSTTTNKITYSMDNGSYSYAVSGPENYAPSPSSGKVVVYGDNVTVDVAFTTTLHHVTFNFNGDLAGTSWELNVAGGTHVLTTSSLTLIETNGLYDYTVATDSEYTATPSSGSVLVLDSDSVVNISITQKTYTVTFQHEGMTAGTEWSVTLGEQTLNTTSTTITFQVPLGNYTYTVSDVNGYSTSSGDGYVNVQGEPQVVNVSFSKNPDYLTAPLLIVAGAAIGIAAGVGIGLLYSRRKK